ncbi:DNA segment, Chr 8, ERATO Doi 457, expressed, isoform CRA_a, partial [Mus musculus]
HSRGRTASPEFPVGVSSSSLQDASPDALLKSFKCSSTAVRKVENAVEESWSLRAAGFLLLGQLSGFAKQCWYFLQAEKTT